MCWKKKPPIKDMTRDDAIWWIEYDIELHQEWLKKPESAETGTYAWHRQWISDFNGILKWLRDEPSPLSYREAINVLYKAEATHVEDAKKWPKNSYEYRWNYDWYWVYDSIIKII